MEEVLIFEVIPEEDGGFVAECLTQDIFTQGDNWEELKNNIQEAVKGFYFDKNNYPKVRLHIVHDQILPIK